MFHIPGLPVTEISGGVLMKTAWGMIFLLSAAAGERGATGFFIQAEPVSLMITSSAATYKIGAPIEIKVVLKNVSSDTITLINTNPACDYSVIVKLNEVVVPKTQKRTSWNCGLDRTTGHRSIEVLKPGQSMDSTIDISEISEISMPGQYEVELTRVLPKVLGDKEIASNILALSVSN
jgi:hypothetical protein